MEKLLSIRLPLAWLLMVTIATAGMGIVVMLLTYGSAPSNAVLIERLEDEANTRSTPVASAVASAVSAENAESLFSSSKTTANIQATHLPTPSSVAVYVSGAVASPGVYTLPLGSRVDQALKAAGGATGEADLERINLAAYVSDQEHVRVPRIGETPVAATPISTRPQRTATSASPTSFAIGEKLDLNRATALELEELPGIGPVLATRIVDDRDKHGPFRSIDELMRVPGIKEGILSQIREFLTIAP